MSLRVIGAGLGRTGTTSLKLALEPLLGGRCYHMEDVMADHDQDVFWREAVRGADLDLDGFLAPYAAAVDWPVCGFWRELARSNPGALILLSTRASAEAWWGSMERTIVPSVKGRLESSDAEWRRHGEVVIELFERRLCEGWDDPAQAMAAYSRHNDAVREEAEPGRLLEWQPGDGWEPICDALGVPVPDEPFPHENTTAAFTAWRRS